MRAIILAAGRGSRMGALTEKRPKCLVPLHAKPLLEWQLEALRGAGITEIAAVRGYCADALDNYGLQYFDNPRWAVSNMVTSLTHAAAWLHTGPCVVSYSDIFYGADIVTKLRRARSPICMTYDTDWLSLWEMRFADPLDDAETFRVDAHRNIREIGHRPKSVAEVQGQYMGLLKFTPAGWRIVERFLKRLPGPRRDKLSVTEMLGLLIEDGTPIRGVPVQGGWGEIDSLADLEAYDNIDTRNWPASLRVARPSWNKHATS